MQLEVICAQKKITTRLTSHYFVFWLFTKRIIQSTFVRASIRSPAAEHLNSTNCRASYSEKMSEKLAIFSSVDKIE